MIVTRVEIQAMQYLFKRGRPAIFFEIYLPKKSGFQEPLYNALTEGRKSEAVREYLLENADDIQAMLSRDWPELSDAFSKDFIEQCAADVPKVYVGYSMYEVDGVYFSPDSHLPVEERSQVIRLFFIYEINEEWPEEFISQIRVFLQSPNTQFQPSAHDSPELENAFREVEEWKKHVAVFLIGFVLHRIIAAIRKKPELRQDEIWLTSFWNAIVNRFVPV